MRIDLNAGVPPTPDSGSAGKSGARTTPGVGSGEPGADVAHLSADPARVQALAAAVSQLPEIRQERVTALAESLRSRTYEVTAQQTAGALMAHMVPAA